MDSLDIRLLRAMCRGGVFTLQGVEPRLSLQELARRSGVGRITVRRRLGLWQQSGFWRRVVAFPNPDLLGSSFWMQGLQLDAGRDHARLERALEHALAPAISFHVQDFICPLLLSETEDRDARRQAALRKSPGVRVLCSPVKIDFPRSAVRFSRRDWTILRALRESAAPDWVAAAGKAGVTLRGLERRVQRLMDGNALFFFPELDFRRSPGTVAWMGVLLGGAVPAEEVRAELQKRFPDVLLIENIFPFQIFLPPHVRLLAKDGFPLFLPVTSASIGEQLRREITSLPGVLDVLVAFPTRNICYGDAWDERISRADRLTADND